MFPFTTWHRMRRQGLLGQNARNGECILPWNDRRFYPLVDNKITCKERLQAHGLPVPELLERVSIQRQASRLRQRLQDLSGFAIKPASGSGGDGILIIAARRADRWVTPSGRLCSASDIRHHVSAIINGMYSLAGLPDEAMVEALVRPDPRLFELAPEGVPDIRVIVYRGVPVMAMVRLPTRSSGGKANLHQGAIGAGIRLDIGETSSAVMDNRLIDEHPDTGASVAGFRFWEWDPLLELTARCHDAVGLGYLGVDIVLDRDRGPLLLELNARPGLGIQIANRRGLGPVLARVDAAWEPDLSPAERVRLGQEAARGAEEDTEDSRGSSVSSRGGKDEELIPARVRSGR